MNKKEINEIRKHLSVKNNPLTRYYGCLAAPDRRIVSTFERTAASMGENEQAQYLDVLRHALSGPVGKHLHEIDFSQGENESPEHKLLMQMRESELKNPDLLNEFYEKVVEAYPNPTESFFAVLLSCDNYDIPVRSHSISLNEDVDDVTEPASSVYRYLLCTVCPVPNDAKVLEYIDQSQDFHESGDRKVIRNPAIGFVFPSFNDRTADIHSAMFYTRDYRCDNEAILKAIFDAKPLTTIAAQRDLFSSLMASSLGNECDLETVRNLQACLEEKSCAEIEEQKAEVCTVSKEELNSYLAASDVSEEARKKFEDGFSEAFGSDAKIPVANLIKPGNTVVSSPFFSLSYKSSSDIVSTRIIDGKLCYVIEVNNADGLLTVDGIPLAVGNNPLFTNDGKIPESTSPADPDT